MVIRGEGGRSDRSLSKALPSWRREALRTNFWLVPTVLVLVAGALFAVTFSVDLAAYHGDFRLPFWIRTGSADAGREVLISIAAGIITVVGVVFSITIVALTLASQQFGPRMMRNFVRDLGNQFTLGVFVGTFVYAVLALGSITSEPRGDFVPHLSITVAEALLLVDLAVLIYFIHHIAKTIQLPEVIASIARDLMRAIDDEFPDQSDDEPGSAPAAGPGRSVEEIQQLVETRGAVVPASTSGYLQFVSYTNLVEVAMQTDSVIRLNYRPGHFLVAGHPVASVWPQGAAQQVSHQLAAAHITGPHRTLMQDPVFAIDQLVEIAIRALSPAVNDTFTALTCIDWLSAGLSRVSTRELVEGVYRDKNGRVRLIESDPSYARMVDRAFDKIRQAAQGMPAVLIRLLAAIAAIMHDTVSAEQRRVLRRQADMIYREAQRSVTEPNDLADIRERYELAAGGGDQPSQNGGEPETLRRVQFGAPPEVGASGV
jgi:uncharacterized membrane protein